ncbi:MAG: SIR2 family protein [Ruminococcus flavefaciens]|nr:SIR2 family protein [Ruminococcus flavefaciens]
MNIKYGNINNIINRINSIKQGTYKKQKVCVLIGAGADISSGGVLFRELKILFLRENGCMVPSIISDRSLDEQFENQIEKMSQDGRCETLENVMRNHKTPSEGYLLLVMLAEMGLIDAVITTNFDCLLEETQKLLNSKPFTIFTPGRALPKEYFLRRSKIPPFYLKMHGDLSDRLVTHLTKNEICNKNYSENFINLFEYIIQNYSIIIVGYGGYDDLITEIFKQKIDQIDEVYWCNICAPKEDSNLACTLESKLCYVNTSFDTLFQKLSRNLLRDVKLKNANPFFVPTVVQSKMDHQIAMYKERFGNSNQLIERIDAFFNLKKYLTSFTTKCIAIVGDRRFGKSCFTYKSMTSLPDIEFLPVFFNQKYSILENMARALGYETNIPFPIMYAFSKWRNETHQQLVFIIDDCFNTEIFQGIESAKLTEFFNFLYVVREFRCIQFIICFQNEIYNELEKNDMFSAFGNIISKRINIGNFFEEDITKFLSKNYSGKNISIFKKQKLLYIPYVWEIINKNNIMLSEKMDFITQYVNVIYNDSVGTYDFTKYALNRLLRQLAFKQLFNPTLQIDTASQEYAYLTKIKVIDSSGKLIYPELTEHFCKEYMLKSASFEDVISKTIIPKLQGNYSFSSSQLDVYISVLAEMDDIEKFDVVLQGLDKLVSAENVSFSSRKVTIKVLKIYLGHNANLFENYLRSIDINRYSFQMQYYLFKVCAELRPGVLELWNRPSDDAKLSYAAFVLCDDILYDALKNI